MTCHRKSPRSRSNLVVIDPFTPSQGHQFDCRLNFFSVCSGILPIPFNLICHMTMIRNLIFDPSPRPQGTGTPKNVLVHVPFMWVTHTPNLVEFRKKLTPQPPTVSPSPTPGHDPGGRMKIPYDMLYIFHLWEDTQCLVQDFVIQIKWYLTFWSLPKAPGGRDPKIGAGACAIHVSNSHTKSEWILKWKILTSPTPTVPLSPTPGAWPRRPNENPVWYVLYL